MKCPACSAEMIEKDFGGVKVDVCENGCKGIWLDWMEISKLDEKNEGFGKALQAAIKSPRINDENRPPLDCPKCGVKMRVHRYKRADEVNVDECYSCGGFFLDSGELRAIRENFMSDEEHEKYVRHLVGDIPEVEEAEADQAARKVRADAAMKATRYIRATYYLTGR